MRDLIAYENTQVTATAWTSSQPLTIGAGPNYTAIYATMLLGLLFGFIITRIGSHS